MTTPLRRTDLARALMISGVLALGACSSDDDDETTPDTMTPDAMEPGTTDPGTGEPGTMEPDTMDPPEGSTTIEVMLSPLQEVPPVTGAEGAGGSGTLVVDTDTGTISATVTPTGLTGPAQAAHIHQAMAGMNGGVIVPLEDPDEDGTFTVPESDRTLEPAELEALAAGGLYFNVHTEANMDGEVRGQIIPEGVSFFVVEASGDQEVAEPPVVTDASGTGVITIQADGATTATLFTRGIGGEEDDKAAHVHRGASDENGDVIIGLERADDADTPADLDVWRSPEGASLDAESRAGGLYFNAHSTDHPGGEVRAQIKDAD